MSVNNPAVLLVIEGDEMLKGKKGPMFLMFGNKNKLEGAANKYVQAANLHKVQQEFKEAGAAFILAADVNARMGRKTNVVSHVVEAANCFKRADTGKAMESYERAIDLYNKLGRFTFSAKMHRALAELCESLNDCPAKKTVANYEKAAQYFDMEGQTASANQCYLKVATHYATMEKYSKAIEAFDRVAQAYSSSPLLRHAAKDPIFKAIICSFCLGGTVNAALAQRKYVNLYEPYADSREYYFVNCLIEAAERQNKNEFTELVTNYNIVAPMNRWMKTLLRRVKNSIGGSDQDDGGEPVTEAETLM